MSTRRATVVRVYDSVTLIIRPEMAVKLAGVEPPKRGTAEEDKARSKFESLVLGKKVEFETLEWDRMGRSIAVVRVEGVNVNDEMRKFIASLNS